MPIRCGVRLPPLARNPCEPCLRPEGRRTLRSWHGHRRPRTRSMRWLAHIEESPPWTARLTTSLGITPGPPARLWWIVGPTSHSRGMTGGYRSANKSGPRATLAERTRQPDGRVDPPTGHGRDEAARWCWVIPDGGQPIRGQLIRWERRPVSGEWIATIGIPGA
jgi:hypothetical protein